MITGKVIGTEIDQNGNIKVATEYTLTDGSKKIGHTRYNFLNFTPENVQKDVKAHCETLMRKIYGLKRHQELVQAGLPVIEHNCESVEIVIKPEVKDEEGNIIQEKKTLIIDDK